MTDRTKAQLDVLFADNNTGAISEGDLRDFVDSVLLSINSIRPSTTGDITLSAGSTNVSITSSSSAASVTVTVSEAAGVTSLESVTGAIDLIPGSSAFTITGNSTGGTISLDIVPANIDHDSLSGYVANEHIDHSSVSITAGSGLSGGGDITSSRTLSVNIAGQTSATPAVADNVLIADSDAASQIRKVTAGDLANLADHNQLTNYVANRHIDHSAVSITAGTGLSGGGDITTSRTLSVDATALDHDDLQNVGTNTHAQIDTHLANTSNPHSVTATQVGALASIDGVSNAGGNIDLIAGSTNVTITPDDGANTITFTVAASTGGGGGAFTADGSFAAYQGADSDAGAGSNIGSFAQGSYAVASGNYGSFAQGFSATASGNSGSFSQGGNFAFGALASGSVGSFAQGIKATASGGYGCFAQGFETLATANGGCFGQGSDATASGSNGSFAQGINATASGTRGSFAQGNTAIASGSRGSFAQGNSATAQGHDGSFAQGSAVTASNSYGHIGNFAQGKQSTSTCARGGFAQGELATASGAYGCFAQGGNGNILTQRVQAVGYTGVFAQGRICTASGSNGVFAQGWYAVASSNNGSFAQGIYSTASGGAGSFAQGYSVTASAAGSWAVGTQAVADKRGQHARASGRFSANGDAQYSTLILRNNTTDATQTELFLNGSSERVSIASGKAYTFCVSIIARQHAGASGSVGDCWSYKLEGAIRNTSGTTALVNSILKTVLAEDDAAFDVTAEADNTNDALVIKVTGAASKSVRWVARCELVEVG